MFMAKYEGIELPHPLISKLKYVVQICSNDIFSFKFLYIQFCELLSSDNHLQFFNNMYMYIEIVNTVVGGGKYAWHPRWPSK